ncbi:leucine-rich repeat receptor-like protein CLAVATA2 [Ananas comosus]|uniref:Leucine-rich repeat receptor-like protein CLAVATA2 n=1 Tax=Ananas comosus TaxID=4615 RepID=A0A6P5EG63_ANACO|nr:leucine-rich repeat receptor-like protein CLAVATA2 [Ananas comosus]
MASCILSFLLLILSMQANRAIGCIERERNTLLSFKAGLPDPSNFLSSWEGRDCCKWTGVVCSNTTSHVVKLKLGNLALSGEINPSLSLLSDLKHLDLSMNNFHGNSIPTHIGSLQKLKYLNLSNAWFNGIVPAQLGNLSNLRYLDLIPNWNQVVNMLPSLEVLHLKDCLLSGIPTSLPYVNFTSLKVLDLSGNLINSTLPKWLWNLSRITHLDLSYNNLHGFIHDEFSCLKSLNVLSLRGNNFKGEFPSSLQYCRQLVFLDLGHNKFSGAIPTWIGEKSLSSLMILSLHANMFSGSIPPQVLQLGYLQVLDLSHNNLSGIIPRSIGNFSWMALSKSGKTKNMGVFKLETYLDFSASFLFVIKGAERLFSNILEFMESIDLSDNNLSGEIPDEIGDLWALQNLNLSRNHLSGNIPEIIGKMKSLESLDLRMNNLSSTIPQSLSALTYLNHLNLSYNNLSGPIPTGNQLQTLPDPSIYISNPYLCGPPTTKNCSTNESVHDLSEGTAVDSTSLKDYGSQSV